MIKNRNTKFGWKEYFKPTPKRIRVFGDSLAAAGTLGASIAVLNGHTVVGTSVLILAVAGKFMSNFFTDEEPKKNEPEKPSN